MAQLRISRAHGTTVKKAQAAVDKIAAQMADSFDIQYEWDGPVLRFQRSGVQGTMTVERHTLEIDAQLGMLVGMLKPKIESEVNRLCDEQFGAQA